jgi:hypothetical protein
MDFGGCNEGGDVERVENEVSDREKFVKLMWG